MAQRCAAATKSDTNDRAVSKEGGRGKLGHRQCRYDVEECVCENPLAGGRLISGRLDLFAAPRHTSQMFQG